MDRILVLAGNLGQFENWRRTQEPEVSNQALYVDREDQLLGCSEAKIVRTGEWWLNPVYDHPMVRMYEYKWWCEHPTLDCGDTSRHLVWPEDLRIAPYCPHCMIREQERIIGDLAGRLKSFGVILAGEQAQRAIVLAQIEELHQ